MIMRSLYTKVNTATTHFSVDGHQFINRQLQRLHSRQSTNVSLNDNLYDQVRIAYAIPRQISIVTVSDGSRINMFPTDLHGPIGENVYAGSLRIGGLANNQVETYKRIVISKVDASFYRESYALGKNHMAELQGVEEFSISPERSHVFDFPLPRAVVSYQELKHIDSLDYGIHRIHLYEVVHRKEAAAPGSDAGPYPSVLCAVET